MRSHAFAAGGMLVSSRSRSFASAAIRTASFAGTGSPASVAKTTVAFAPAPSGVSSRTGSSGPSALILVQPSGGARVRNRGSATQVAFPRVSAGAVASSTAVPPSSLARTSSSPPVRSRVTGRRSSLPPGRLGRQSIRNRTSRSVSVTVALPSAGTARSGSGNRASRTSGDRIVQSPHHSARTSARAPPAANPTRTSSLWSGEAARACGAGSRTGCSNGEVNPRPISGWWLSVASIRPLCGSSRTQPSAYRSLSAWVTSQAARRESAKPSPGSRQSSTTGGLNFAARSRSFFSTVPRALRGTPRSSQLATTERPPSASARVASPPFAAPASVSSENGSTRSAGGRSPGISSETPRPAGPQVVKRAPPSSPACSRTGGPSSRAFRFRCFFATVRKLCSVRRASVIGGGMGPVLLWVDDWD